MDVSQIVIQQPFGTTLVTVDARVGPLEGDLDSNVGANLIGAEGFGIGGPSGAYFQPGGANPGEQATVGLSESGIVSLTLRGVPGGAMMLREPGSRSAVHGHASVGETPSGPLVAREPGTRRSVHGHSPVGETPGSPTLREPGTRSPIPKPWRSLSRGARDALLRRKRTP